ncbi:MAG: replicative DNA helicase [Rickettsiales bacterium]|jgi:replicative DNA helicase|nr:replicative DNA helicase [Rickettsiales bacterium]
MLTKTSKNLNSPTLSRVLPVNTLAEQMILGSILTNNEYYNRVSDFLQANHFYEPVHQRIFEAITIFIDRGMLANPVTLKNHFDQDPTLKEMNQNDYLSQLSSLATTIININDYSKTIVDLSIRRNLINVGENIVNDAYSPEVTSTSNEQIERAEQELFSLANIGKESNSNLRAIKSSLNEALNKIQLAFKRNEKITGISTGFIDLDKILCGLQNSDLLILAARPSMGKTALAVNLALNACQYLHHQNAKNDENLKSSIGFFSLEMSAEQLATRMMSISSEVNSSKLRSGQITENDFIKIVKASKDLANLDYFIDDTPSISIAALRTRARRMKRKHNLSLLVIDYLQLIKGSSRNGEGSRVQEISEITQGLKAIAKELNIPVIALSQLSRAVEQREDKRPLLSDLRESGSIEQDADIVMFIYRDEYYLIRKQPQENTADHEKWQSEMDKVTHTAEVIIAKQRNGPVGSIKLHFDSNIGKFSNHIDM